jgi:hypothetical protein
MKNLFALFLLFTAFVGFSQENAATQDAKWTIGLGTNFIDNSSTVNNQFLNSSKHWNFIPAFSIFSVERSFSENLSVSSTIALNVISSDKLQNGTTIAEDVNYYGLDINGKFFFDDFIVKQSKIDSYVVLGLGINSSDDITNQTGNLGLGFNFWFKPNLGLRLQSVGKYGFEQETLLNNHIQHSAELVLKF